MLLSNSPFWKNHHELCGWREWRRPGLLEAAGLHTRPRCTMTGCSSKHINTQASSMLTCYADAAQCSVAAVLPGASPVCHSASCLQDEGNAHPSVWPWAGADHSVRCSSPPWPTGQFKYVRYDLTERYKHWRCSSTHVVWKDISDSHEDSVSCSHRGQMQPQLQITHGVTAEVLQLQTQTKNALILPCPVFLSNYDLFM